MIFSIKIWTIPDNDLSSDQKAISIKKIINQGIFNIKLAQKIIYTFCCWLMKIMLPVLSVLLHCNEKMHFLIIKSKIENNWVCDKSGILEYCSNSVRFQWHLDINSCQTRNYSSLIISQNLYQFLEYLWSLESEHL